MVVWLFNSVNVLREYERGVVFRLGRLPPQDIITRDNVSVKVNAVAYFRVMDAIKAIVEVENYLYAISQ